MTDITKELNSELIEKMDELIVICHQQLNSVEFWTAYDGLRWELNQQLQQIDIECNA